MSIDCVETLFPSMPNKSSLQPEFIDDTTKRHGTCKGLNYFFEFICSIDSDNGKRCSARVSLVCQSQGNFKISMRSFSFLFKMLGIFPGLKTQDAGFDIDYYITSKIKDFARRLFHKSDIQQAVKEIFKKGIHKIKYDGNFLTASWDYFPNEQRVEIKRIEEVVVNLGVLAREIPLISQEKIC